MMDAALTAVEKANRAFQDWVVSTDPPPTGMDIATWVHVVESYGPDDMTLEEVNEAGRHHWGKYWRDR